MLKIYFLSIHRYLTDQNNKNFFLPLVINLSINICKHIQGVPKNPKTIEITIVKIRMPFQTAERNDA